ncbi:MAG TPA: pilus assembly protein [Sphingomonas sp.]
MVTISSGSGGLRRLFWQLLREDAGNVLMLTAALLIPLTALIGSGIDLGRIYVARQRMQVACDAASLAGRRAVSAGATATAVQAEATKFFNYNFPQQSYGTATFTPDAKVSTDSTQTVTVTANTTLPMSVMTIFGFTTQPISVTCNASQNYVNTDVVLVLDTTGSMADKAVSTDTETKIQGLRDAVMAFYNTMAPVQAQLSAAGMRMRIGIVPYSSAVNVGGIVQAVNPTYIVSDNWTYQSRQIVTDATANLHTQSQCTNTVLTTNTSQAGLSGTWNSSTKKCTYFSYAPISRNVAQFVAGSTVDVTPLIGKPSDSNGVTPSTSTSANNTTWGGCIEERDTTQMSATTTSIDPAATDLDIDLIPTTNANRWRPYWPEVEYQRTYTGYVYSNDMMKPQYACPAAAKRLQWWSHDDLLAYVNSLNPDGGTYHDNGMRWGMRLGSPNGIFGSDNPSTFNGMPVNRFIIFMTDGIMDTGYSTLYSSYGVEQWDARVTPGGSASNETDQLNRHLNRFDLLCSKAKSTPYNYNIWVIGFAQALDTHLTNCASNAGQASTAANSAALIAKFQQIGQNIGALRLTR